MQYIHTVKHKSFAEDCEKFTKGTIYNILYGLKRENFADSTNKIYTDETFGNGRLRRDLHNLAGKRFADHFPWAKNTKISSVENNQLHACVRYMHGVMKAYSPYQRPALIV